MGRECDICGKKPQVGNLVSHSNIKTRTRWLPNLKSVKAFFQGKRQRITACTQCIKSGKVIKPTVNS